MRFDDGCMSAGQDAESLVNAASKMSANLVSNAVGYISAENANITAIEKIGRAHV